MVCRLGPVLAALVSRWGKCPWLGGSSVGGFPRCPPLSTHGRYLTVQLPQRPHLFLSWSLRYTIINCSGSSLYLNNSPSLLATNPLGSPRDSCHSLVSYFVSCWKKSRKTKTRKTTPSPPPKLRQSLHLPPFSDAFINTTICNLPHNT